MVMIDLACYRNNPISDTSNLSNIQFLIRYLVITLSVLRVRSSKLYEIDRIDDMYNIMYGI